MGTGYEYAKSLVSHPRLVDRLKFGGEGGSELTATKKFLYPEHLPLSVIQSGLKSGKFLQGVFQSLRENYLEGLENVQPMERWVLVQGLEKQNRTVYEDIVVIELFPESKWSSSLGVVSKDVEETASEVNDD